MQDPIRKIVLSRYASRVLTAHPEWRAELADAAPFARAGMAAALAGAAGGDEAALMRRLRELRQRVVLRVMARDLCGRANLDEVCGTMSDLAETCISCALDWMNAAPDQEKTFLAVIGRYMIWDYLEGRPVCYGRFAAGSIYSNTVTRENWDEAVREAVAQVVENSPYQGAKSSERRPPKPPPQVRNER